MYSYHLSLSQGRTDTIKVEASNKSDLLSFFNTVSTAIVSNIKKVVYSKELGINYTQSLTPYEPYYLKVNIFCKSATKAKTFQLYHVRKTATKETIISNFKKYILIDGEPILEVYSILVYEGFARLDSQ